MGIKHSLVANSSKTITSSAWNADHIVDSTALITNLNADLLDGYHASNLGPTHGHSISQVTINSNVIPTSDLSFDLGSSSNKFSKAYIGTIYPTAIDNTVTILKALNFAEGSNTIVVRGGTFEPGRLKISSPYGYVEIGAPNIGYSHFFTDRPAFWFNAPIELNGHLKPYTFPIDLGDSSRRFRTLYVSTINANTISGAIDWSQINNKPSVTGYITPYAGDETEITVTSTSDTTIKNANVVRLSSVLGTFSTMIFVMEGKVTSGNTLYLSAYLSGNLVATKTFTTTSYSLGYCQANTGGFGDGVYSVELKARVSGGTGYNRIFEVYLR